MEGMKRIPVLLGRNKAQWAAEGLDLVIVADARLVPLVRYTMRQELEESTRGIRYLPCFYMESDNLPTLGVGTHMYGSGWQVHTGSRLNVERLLALVNAALVSPWIQIAPSASQGLLDTVEKNTKASNDSVVAYGIAG